MKRTVLIAVVMGAACSAPSGSPSLSVTTMPLVRGQSITIRVTASDAQGQVGAGTVRLSADMGSLATPETKTLDSFGTAVFQYSCDVALDAQCSGDRATVTATWFPPNGARLVDARASVEFTSSGAGGGGSGTGGGGGTGGGSGGGAPSYANFANAMYLNGSDGGWVFEGQLLETSLVFSARFDGTTGPAQGAQWPSMIRIYLSQGPGLGTEWNLSFATPLGTNFDVGTYTMAERASFRAAGKPGIDIGGMGHGCNTTAGEFSVVDFALSPDGGVGSTTITFTQDCEGRPGNRLRGWVRYGH